MSENPIAKYLRETGLTQQQLSQATGIPPPMISEWANDVGCPSVDSAVKLQRLTKGKIKVEDWAGRTRTSRSQRKQAS